MPSEVPKVAPAEELALECCLAKQETRRTSKNGVVDIEERSFDFRRWGLGHLTSLVAHGVALVLMYVIRHLSDADWQAWLPPLR